MARIFLVILLFLHYEVFAQKTVTVKKEIKGQFKFQSFKEKYRVLEDNRSVMHGLYELFDSKNRLLTAGHYKLGKKDSIWTEYDPWHHYIAVEGRYHEDKKAGIWTFYKKADTMELKYDFDNNKVVYFNADPTKKHSVLTGTDTLKTKLEQPPLYLGGSSYISKIISHNIQYPDEAREKNIQGKVLVAFTIYPNGRASAPWIFSSIHKSLDDEALGVATKIPANWAAGIQNGQPITSIFILPIAFMLE